MTTLARRAIRAYPRHDTADRRTTNHLRRGWMRAVEILGPKWRAMMKWTPADQAKVEKIAAKAAT